MSDMAPIPAELWAFSDDGGHEASADVLNGDRIGLRVGCGPRWHGEEPEYTIVLGPEEALALGKRLVRWAEEQQT
jgi:hypothetical protein